MNKQWFAADVKAGKGISTDFGVTTNPGCLTVEAKFAHTIQPIGTVWYSWAGKRTIQILGSYVQDSFRRLGVRTRLHNAMLEAYPKLRYMVTDEGNKQSIPWLKKMGFQKTKLDGWQLTID